MFAACTCSLRIDCIIIELCISIRFVCEFCFYDLFNIQLYDRLLDLLDTNVRARARARALVCVCVCVCTYVCIVQCTAYSDSNVYSAILLQHVLSSTAQTTTDWRCPS
jgi:hypothetical protein